MDFNALAISSLSINTASSYRITDGVFSSRGIANYSEKRNRALVNLVNTGFNCPSLGQRLSLIMAPILKNQIDEVADMYEWAARMNMPLIIAPSMESGPKAKSLVDKVVKLDRENQWLKDIFIAIYKRAFAMGIKSKEDLLSSGLSAYIGSEGCNQVANGLMIRLNGQVKICPGSSKPQHIYGKLYDEKGNFAPHKLMDIWLNSPNCRLGPLTNNWCPAKNTMLPVSLRQEVLEGLLTDETLVSSSFGCSPHPLTLPVLLPVPARFNPL